MLDYEPEYLSERIISATAFQEYKKGLEALTLEQLEINIARTEQRRSEMKLFERIITYMVDGDMIDLPRQIAEGKYAALLPSEDTTELSLTLGEYNDQLAAFNRSQRKAFNHSYHGAKYQMIQAELKRRNLEAGFLIDV